MKGDVTDANTAALDKALARFPNAKAQTRQQFIDNQISGLSSVLNILYVLLALSVIVSLFGIVNTLVLTVFERTREIGMLRAIGMTRRQVRRMIRHESVITALIGAALGIVLGIVLAALLIARVDFLVFSFPTTQVIVFVIAAIVVGHRRCDLPGAARREARSARSYRVRMTPSRASAAISSRPSSRSPRGSRRCARRPRAGPMRCVARSRSNDSGSAGSRRSGMPSCSTAWSIPSACVCSAATTSATSATGAAGTPAAVRRSLPVGGVALPKPDGDERDELLAVAHAIRVRPEALVRLEVGQLEHVAEQSEEPVVAAGHHELAVARGEHLVRRDHREHRSLAGRHRAVGQVADEVVADVPERGLVERRVDDGPAAGSLALEQRRRRSRARPTSPSPCR